MVPALRGVTFVEDKPAVEGDRKAHQSYEIENRREQPGSCHRTSDKAGQDRPEWKTIMKRFEERNTMATRIETSAGRTVDLPKVGPRYLPYAAYPKARDVAQHGLQTLPESLPLADFAQAEPYRGRYTTVLATELTMHQLLQMAWMIDDSFAHREPQASHLRPPKYPPAGAHGGTPHRSVRFRSVRFVGHGDAHVLDRTPPRADRPDQPHGCHRGK